MGRQEGTLVFRSSSVSYYRQSHNGNRAWWLIIAWFSNSLQMSYIGAAVSSRSPVMIEHAHYIFYDYTCCPYRFEIIACLTLWRNVEASTASHANSKLSAADNASSMISGKGTDTSTGTSTETGSDTCAPSLHFSSQPLCHDAGLSVTPQSQQLNQFLVAWLSEIMSESHFQPSGQVSIKAHPGFLKNSVSFLN